MKTGLRMKKGMAHALVVALVVSLLYTPFVHQTQEAHASDYLNHWASQHMMSLAFQNIMRGDHAGNFNPNRTITRAEFAAMLNRAFGFSRSGGESFPDVNSTAWYADDISYAAYQGFLQGTGEGANPNGPLSREEAVTMLCRALKIEEVPRTDRRFADDELFASWSRGSINAAVEKGILSGYPDGTFKPQNSISRGEVAKILATTAGQIVNQTMQASMGYVNGNVTLAQTGAGLRNTIIAGDLYITEGVWGGYVFLENVTVLGDIIIIGAGESHASMSSIVFTNCDINNIIIDVGHDKITSLLTQGDTRIANIKVKTNTYLEESSEDSFAYRRVELNGPDNTTLNLAGRFGMVEVGGINNILNLHRGSIDTLIVAELGTGSQIFLERGTVVDELLTDSDTTVTGRGEINYLSIGANGVTVEQMPSEIVIRPGVTAMINGREMGHLEAALANATPRIMNGYPQAHDITVNSANGQIMANKPGTIFWGVQKDGDLDPTREELLNPRGTQNLLQTGNMPLRTENLEDELSARITGLTSGELYDIFVMMTDERGVHSRVAHLDEPFRALDRTAPRFIRGLAAIDSRAVTVEHESVDGPYYERHLEFDVVASEDARLYWIVLPGGHPVAPTATQLYSDTGMPNVQVNRGDRWLGEGLQVTVQMRKAGGLSLDENTSYDVYLGLRDPSGNTSGVSTKITLRTDDRTPPDFIHPYPQQRHTAAGNRMEVEYMVNEGGTLYWSLFRRDPDRPFPPQRPLPGAVVTSTGEIVSSWDSEEAKLAVKNRMGNPPASGNVAIRAPGVPQTLAITVPAQDIAADIFYYDLYLMLEDAVGNQSYVGKMEINRTDPRDLVARMLYETLPEGPGQPVRPTIGSNIMIEFNRPAWVSGTQDASRAPLVRLAELGRLGDLENRVLLREVTADGIVPVDITYNNIRVTEMDGRTILHFQSTGEMDAVSGAAVALKSGATYFFELQNIQDEQGGPLYGRDPTTGRLPLERFTMRSAFVDFREVTINDAYEAEGFHFIFDVVPTAQSKNAAENLFYDTILEANKNIQIELWWNMDMGGGLQGMTNGGIQAQSIITGRYYMMQHLKTGSASSRITEIFKEMEPRRYGVKIVGMDSGIDEIQLSARGVSGLSPEMSWLMSRSDTLLNAETAVNGPPGSVDQNHGQFVGFPNPLNIWHYNPDRTAPMFSENFPQIAPGDVNARIRVSTNKEATAYTLVIPASGFDPGIAVANPPTTPAAIAADGLPFSKEQLKAGTWGTSATMGGQHRAIPVDVGGGVGEWTFEGLAPKPTDPQATQDWYYVFYLLEDTTGNQSAIWYQTFKTVDLTVPRFSSAPIATPGNEMVTVTTQFWPDVDLVHVYWAVWTLGAGQAAATDPLAVVAANPSDVNVIAVGELLVPANTIGRFDVPGLVPGEQYDLYITAKHAASSGAVRTDYVTAFPIPDNTPNAPHYLNVAPLYNVPLNFRVQPHMVRPGAVPGVYTGHVEITFGGQALYSAANQGAQPFPFARTAPSDAPNRPSLTTAWRTIGVNAPLTSVQTGIDASRGDAITSLEIDYNLASIGATMTILARLTNSGGLVGGHPNAEMGRLEITLTNLNPDPDGPPNIQWVGRWL